MEKIKYFLILILLCTSMNAVFGQIESVQYWFDNNFAGRQIQSIASKQSIQLTELNANSLTEGIHHVHIRAKDNNNWSVVHSQMFYKLHASSGVGMQSYEYWVDNDFVNKKTGSLSGETAVISELNVDKYDEGIHMLHIRAFDAIGRYSVVHSQMFLKLAGNAVDNEITQYEYWFDGNFNKRKVATATGKSFIMTEGINMQELLEGFHTMCIRAKDKQNRWSVSHTQSFYVNSIIPDGTNKIKAYRYWYDTNFENHNSVELTEAVNPYELKQKWVLPANIVEGEKHTFHIQFQDLAGRWSVATADSFKVVSPFSEDEFAALKTFYLSTNGDSWKNTLAADAAWDITSIASVNDWKGIIISNGSVVSIELPENNLSGIIPSEIVAKLPNLKSLNVSGNSVESLSDVLPKTVSLNIKSQSFNQGTIDVTKGLDLVVSVLDISLYSHSNGNFNTNNRFDVNINGAYKTRVTAASDIVTIPKSYLNDLKKGDILTVVQYNGDAVGTTYQYNVDGISVAVSSIVLNKSKTTLLVGASETLTYTITPENATNQSVTWESSDSNIVTVENGVLTAIGVGTATVTVTTEDGSKTAKCTATVNPNKVTGISLNKTTTSLIVGGSETLTYIIQPENATNQNVTWSSNNTSIVTVEDGVITGIKQGTATITAKTEDGNKSAKCVVTVEDAAIPVYSITMDKLTTALLIGETEMLTYSINPINATNQNVTWESSNTNIATIANGVLKAIGVGTATITVKTEDGNKTSSCAVSVNPVRVTGITLNKPSLALEVGDSEMLIYTIMPANATNKDATWESDATDIAEVSSEGLVLAKKEGVAIISVISEDGQKKAVSEITVFAPSGINDEEHGIISIYPNPIKNFFYVNQAIGKILRVYSSLGNKVYEREITNKEEYIDAQDWGAGVYIIQIYDKNRVEHIHKVIKK